MAGFVAISMEQVNAECQNPNDTLWMRSIPLEQMPSFGMDHLARRQPKTVENHAQMPMPSSQGAGGGVCPQTLEPRTFQPQTA